MPTPIPLISHSSSGGVSQTHVYTSAMLDERKRLVDQQRFQVARLAALEKEYTLHAARAQQLNQLVFEGVSGFLNSPIDLHAAGHADRRIYDVATSVKEADSSLSGELNAILKIIVLYAEGRAYAARVKLDIAALDAQATALATALQPVDPATVEVAP